MKNPMGAPAICNTILDTIGNTPMVRLNRIAEDIPGAGARESGIFQSRPQHQGPHGITNVRECRETGFDQAPAEPIIECTSGNTGMGLAIAAIVKGYQLICTME